MRKPGLQTSGTGRLYQVPKRLLKASEEVKFFLGTEPSKLAVVLSIQRYEAAGLLGQPLFHNVPFKKLHILKTSHGFD